MTTALMPSRLRSPYEAAQEAHPGLLLQRGLPEHDGEDSDAGKNHIARVCRSDAGEFYSRAYARWRRATSDAARFRTVTLELETRLFVGLAGGGAMETGCAIGHSHGAPYIPGSSVKGVVNSLAREWFDTAEDGSAIRDELFGAPPAGNRPAGLSGLLIFHDAWWVPGSAGRPLVQEVVTSHHRDYYGSDGKKPATDFDSPVPNPQIAVQGSFLFAIEGPPEWLDLAEQMLIAALSARGVGAKTRSGYGLFVGTESATDGADRCEWVDTKIAGLAAEHRTNEDEVLRGRGLARAWAGIDDPTLKEAAFADIRARWREKGWWDNPPGGKSARDARAIYDGYGEADAAG